MITFTNPNETGVQFLDHHSLPFKVSGNDTAVMELKVGVDTNSKTWYETFYNNQINNLNTGLELPESLTVDYDIPDDWGGGGGGDVSDMTGASATSNGKHGLILAPFAGDQDKYFKGDGSWSNLPVFQGVNGSILSVSGMVPAAPEGGENKAFFGDGNWHDVETDVDLSVVAQEETSPSTHAYSIGDQFIYENKLCMAVKSIAVGDELVIKESDEEDPSVYNCKYSDSVTTQISDLSEKAPAIPVNPTASQIAGFPEGTLYLIRQ